MTISSQPDEKQPWRIHETSVSPIPDPLWPAQWPPQRSRIMWRRPPDTDLQSLMEAVPGDTAEDSRAQRNELLYSILDALDSLDDRSRYIFDAWTYQRLSIRKIAVQFGVSKSALHRELVCIRRRLQLALDTCPTVRLHLRNHDHA